MICDVCDPPQHVKIIEGSEHVYICCHTDIHRVSKARLKLDKVDLWSNVQKDPIEQVISDEHYLIRLMAANVEQMTAHRLAIDNAKFERGSMIGFSSGSFVKLLDFALDDIQRWTDPKDWEGAADKANALYQVAERFHGRDKAKRQ